MAQSMYRKKSSARQLSFLLLLGRTHRQTSSEMATFCALRAGKNNGKRGRGAAKSQLKAAAEINERHKGGRVNRNRFEGDPQWSRQELDHAPLSPQLIAAMMAWQLFCIVIQHLTFSPLNSPLMLSADAAPEKEQKEQRARFVSGVPALS